MTAVITLQVTNPPTIELSDPNLALRKAGDSYLQEWAVYPFFAPQYDRKPSAAACDFCCRARLTEWL